MALLGLSLVAASWGQSMVHGLLTAVASRCRAPALACTGSVVVTYGFVALRHVESSWIRDQIHVPCIARQILNHWTTREVPSAESFGHPLSEYIVREDS